MPVAAGLRHIANALASSASGNVYGSKGEGSDVKQKQRWKSELLSFAMVT
jgi:hypothetical protein